MTLPADLHFDPSDFAKLEERGEVCVRRLAQDRTVVATTVDEDWTCEPSHGFEDNNQEDGGGYEDGDGGYAQEDNQVRSLFCSVSFL